MLPEKQIRRLSLLCTQSSNRELIRNKCHFFHGMSRYRMPHLWTSSSKSYHEKKKDFLEPFSSLSWAQKITCKNFWVRSRIKNMALYQLYSPSNASSIGPKQLLSEIIVPLSICWRNCAAIKNRRLYLYHMYISANYRRHIRQQQCAK